MAIKKLTLKSGSASYRVSVFVGNINGKKKYATKRCKTLQEARVIEARLKLAVMDGSYQEEHMPTVTTFQELYDQWWGVYIETVEGSTAYKTKQLFDNHLLPLFKSRRIDSITTGEIQKAVTKWHAVTTNAYKQRFIYLKKVLAFAVKMEYIAKNPADNVELPRGKREAGKLPLYWDKKQCARFLGCIDPVHDLEKYVMFLLLINTGIRREELVALNVQDVNFKTGMLTINKAYATGIDGRASMKGTKSGSSVRNIPLTDDVQQQLSKWIHHLESGKIVRLGGSTRPLFPSPSNYMVRMSLNRPNQWLKSIIETNNLSPVITLHGLRKSFVTNSLQAGVPVSTVQRLAGHASPDITLAVYAGLNQEDARAGVERLAKYMHG